MHLPSSILFLWVTVDTLYWQSKSRLPELYFSLLVTPNPSRKNRKYKNQLSILSRILPIFTQDLIVKAAGCICSVVPISWGNLFSIISVNLAARVILVLIPYGPKQGGLHFGLRKPVWIPSYKAVRYCIQGHNALHAF